MRMALFANRIDCVCRIRSNELNKYAPINVAFTAAQQFRASKRLGAMTLIVRVAFAALLASLAVPTFADVEGSVVGVSDGDTITVLDDARAAQNPSC